MSVEEYQKIIAQYATEPMELEWTPLFLSSEPIVTETEVITEDDDETFPVPKVDTEKDIIVNKCYKLCLIRIQGYQIGNF